VTWIELGRDGAAGGDGDVVDSGQLCHEHSQSLSENVKRWKKYEK
jgi:hypothetical protein